MIYPSCTFSASRFCSPKHVFPEQEFVIAAAGTISSQVLQFKPDTLILCGMYTIGKERFVLGKAPFVFNWALECKGTNVPGVQEADLFRGYPFHQLQL